MKGAIICYSATGNTEAASRCIMERIPNVRFTLFNVADGQEPDLTGCEVLGLAAPTSHMGIPQRLSSCISKLDIPKGMPTFLVNTFGMMPGRSLRVMEQLAASKGLTVFAAHSFNMPENYPPFIAKGWGNAEMPDRAQLTSFFQFITTLSTALDGMAAGRPVQRARISIGVLNWLMRPKGRDGALKVMGQLTVDGAACNRCGTCAKVCPYGAVCMDPDPKHDHALCWGCWRCYNHCPRQAIRASRLNGVHAYPGPSASLRAKLGAASSGI